MHHHGSRLASLVFIALLVAEGAAHAQAAKGKKSDPAAEPVAITVGDWVGEGNGKKLESPPGLAQEGKNALAVSNSKLGQGSYLLTGEVVLAEPGSTLVVRFSKDAPPSKKAPAAPAAADTGPKPLASFSLGLDKDGKKIQSGRTVLEAADDSARRLPLLALVGKQSVEVYVGKFAERRERSIDQPVDLVFALISGARLQNLKVVDLPASNYAPLVAATRLANMDATDKKSATGGIDKASLPQGLTTIDGVPFYFADGENNALDVAASMANIKDPFRNKSFFFSTGTIANGRLVLSAPGEQYSALHLIAYSAGRADHVPRTTVRVGVYGGAAAILEDMVVNVPALSAKSNGGAAGATAVKLAGKKQGYLHHIRVPMPQTGNVKEFKTFDLEFTRDLNTHVLPPDPNEFGKIPVGLPSDVVILAATLEPSPITMEYTSAEAGNVFSDKQKSVFTLTLTNRSKQAGDVRVFAEAAGPGTGEELGIERKTWTVEKKLRLEPGKSKQVELDVTPKRRGWYSCTLGVESGELVQRRDTTFAVLAPDTRKATTDSPFGIWEFWFPHSVARRENQVETLAKLINKGGWRWTYGGSPGGRGDDTQGEFRRLKEQYKIVWSAHSLPQGYQRGRGWFDQAEFDKTIPEAVKHDLEIFDPHFKVMHESRSSLNLLRRYSEYLGGKPYDMPAEEKANLEAQFENVKKYCLAVKKLDSRAKIVLFNDYPSVVFQFLSRGFPKEAFDVIGLEGAMFLRQPERQPDWLSLLGHAHEMKRALAKFGYDKPIWTTEALYHPTEAGALTLHDQGVIAVREAMMALQLGISRMVAAGILKDPSDDYHWSNWGSAGFCFRDPEINPKPSYAMYAWLTQVLDQAKPAGKLATPNSSLHVVDFKRADGAHVYGIWTASGVQTVVLEAKGRPAVSDVFGNPVELAKDGLTLTVSPTPQYITDATLERVVEATAVETPGEIGQVLFDFDKIDGLKTRGAANAVLESSWDTPRMKGKFATSQVEIDGASAMRIELQPDGDERTLLPRYVEYQLAKPIELSGRPYEFTARVKGNGGWGRIMFEVVDAKGRVWTSCGNQYAGASNAADPHGVSFVSFDGWNTMRMPIVGMYPGKDQSAFWPRNYNWWPTNSPEEVELAAQAKEMAAQYQADLKTYETAKKDHATALAKWEADKAEADKAGKKFASAAPKAPVEPKLRAPRNMGLAPVDYPIKLTKLIVTMRPHILYVDEERTVSEPVIFIDKLGVVQPPAGM